MQWLFGILIYIGIKYVMSGANERAELKGTFSKYLIGVALIVLCTTIAAAVAKIADTDGKNNAGGIVDTGFEIGGMKIGTTQIDNDGANGGTSTTHTSSSGRDHGGGGGTF